VHLFRGLERHGASALDIAPTNLYGSLDRKSLRRESEPFNFL